MNKIKRLKKLIMKVDLDKILYSIVFTIGICLMVDAYISMFYFNRLPSVIEFVLVAVVVIISLYLWDKGLRNEVLLY